jgi:hypothetical protein
VARERVSLNMKAPIKMLWPSREMVEVMGA